LLRIAAGRTRVIVERVLKRTCENFLVPLHYRDKENKRNLDYFHTGLYNFLRGEFPSPSPDIRLRIVALENVKATSIWANLLQHDGNLTMGVSRGDAQSFIDAVKQLDDMLRCSTCTSPLRKRTGHMVLECVNRSCQNPDRIS
jgi:hypothetical protein